MADASAMAHPDARLARGATAVRVYLQSEFIRRPVEVLHSTAREDERGVRAFRVQRDGDQVLLRVSEEILEMDTAGVLYLLQRYRVAHALRQMEPDKALLIAADGIRSEAI